MINQETVQAYERALGEVFKGEAYVSVEAAHNGIVIIVSPIPAPIQRVVIPDTVLNASTVSKGALFAHMQGAVRAVLDGKTYDGCRFLGVGLANDNGGAQ